MIQIPVNHDNVTSTSDVNDGQNSSTKNKLLFSQISSNDSNGNNVNSNSTDSTDNASIQEYEDNISQSNCGPIFSLKDDDWNESIKNNQNNKTLSTKHFLSKHIPIHAGERQFKCNYFNKRFKTKYTLTNHILTHTD